MIPQLAFVDDGAPALPGEHHPAQPVARRRRVSRAHEMFDEIAAFTFGHELAHHYRGHTGCAHGQPADVVPSLGDLRRKASQVPWINQLNETEADNYGCIDVLATGRARQATGLRWTEEGGLWLFDFFSRLDAAAGANPLVGFLSTHPAPGLRIPRRPARRDGVAAAQSGVSCPHPRVLGCVAACGRATSPKRVLALAA